MTSMEKLLREIPRVDDLLSHPDLVERAPRPLLRKVIHQVLDRFRHSIKNGKIGKEGAPLADQIRKKIIESIADLQKPHLCRVINGTGILLHTGLGRAPLATEVAEALSQNAGYLMLEIHRESGKRGTREESISRLLCELTGAESVTVVNNNAGATLIALAALARGREVIVSRGQLVEIGGSFRIPDVMVQGGAILKEVGCTNKTHLRDYIQAISENTALLLEVHTSNYRIQGFTETVATGELVQLGQKHNLPVMYDMGSGNLVDLKPFGILDEPTVQEKIELGVDLITFSGDKMLGAGQGGIIVGKEKYVQKIRNHALFRALRPGKLDLVALERTLQIYLHSQPLEKIPALKMISTPAKAHKKRARSLLNRLNHSLFDGPLTAQIVSEGAQIGSGALPTLSIPSFALALSSKEQSAQELSQSLRMGDPPVFTRIKDDQVLINVATLREGEDKELIQILRKL